jgi:hypothetical protein
LMELGRGAGVRPLIHRAQDYFFTVEEV